MQPRHRRFVLELVCDVPDGIRWPSEARALAVGSAEADAIGAGVVDPRDVGDVDLLAALVGMKLAGYDIRTRVRGGHVEPAL